MWFHLVQKQDSALVSQGEMSVPDVSDNRAAESSASCTLGDLLVGHPEENADRVPELQNSGSVSLMLLLDCFLC